MPAEKYRSVLVPLDLGLEADRALPVGAALARRLGVELDAAIITSPRVNPLEDDKEARQHASLLGIELDRVLLAHDDDVAAGILAEAEAAGGLICCSTHARGPAADLFFHSVSGQLVRQSTEPLVLVGPHVRSDEPLDVATLVLCADGSLPLAETLAATSAWARLLAAKVHVVEVAEDGTAVASSPAAERAAQHLVDRGLTADWVLLPDGEPAERIVEVADGLRDPLIVVGTHGRRDHGPAPLGRVSRDVVRHASCPVLVVPPEQPDHPAH